jgi:hypothetical protein
MTTPKLHEEELKDQIDLLLEQLRQGDINVHQFMKLLDMCYKDYIEFHPEEHPYYNDRRRIEQLARGDRDGTSNGN